MATGRMVVEWSGVRQRRVRADASHPNLRRMTRTYRSARIRLVPLWIGVAIVAAISPWPAALITGMLAAFLSFTFLDEREP